MATTDEYVDPVESLLEDLERAAALSDFWAETCRRLDPNEQANVPLLSSTAVLSGFV